METKVLVSDIAASVNATDDDVRSLAPEWQRMIRIDTDGTYYADAANKNYLWGALYSTADRRKDARVETANTELTKAYDALKAASATCPKSTAGRLVWQETMLAKVRQVRDALVELAEARVDASALSPAAAAQIRTDADRLVGDAERGNRQVIRRVRGLVRNW